MDAIRLTDAARSHLIELLQMTEQTAVLLRVNSKGCGGHAYEMRFVDPEFGGEVVMLDDQRRLILDQQSLGLMRGTLIDLLAGSLESRLIFANPAAVGHCGCGDSFMHRAK